MRVRTRPPVHPGTILKQHYLDSLGISIAQAAETLGISRKTLSKIVNGRGAVTPDMALRLSTAFRTTPELWLNLQRKTTTCGKLHANQMPGARFLNLSLPSDLMPNAVRASSIG